MPFFVIFHAYIARIRAYRHQYDTGTSTSSQHPLQPFGRFPMIPRSEPPPAAKACPEKAHHSAAVCLFSSYFTLISRAFEPTDTNTKPVHQPLNISVSYCKGRRCVAGGVLDIRRPLPVASAVRAKELPKCFPVTPLGKRSIPQTAGPPPPTPPILATTVF